MQFFTQSNNALKGLKLGALTLMTLMASTYTLAESCPALSTVKATNVNGIYEYSVDEWKGTNEETGADPANVDYTKADGMKFSDVMLAQRKVGSQGEDPADKPDSVISFVKCNYEGKGKNDRVRLSLRTPTMASGETGIWADENKSTSGNNKNSAGTVNKECKATSVSACTFTVR
ncbi:hypothetical protein [Pseudomonas sp. LB1P83]